MIGGNIMFVCVECGNLFKDPVYWVERHGLDSPPYEHWSGSPCCFANYTEANECDCCGEWITGNYIKIEDGKRYCENCYITMELGDED